MIVQWRDSSSLSLVLMLTQYITTVCHQQQALLELHETDYHVAIGIRTPLHFTPPSRSSARQTTPGRSLTSSRAHRGRLGNEEIGDWYAIIDQV